VASQDERYARNRTPAQLFVAGSTGTALANSDADIILGRADPATGAQYVYNLGPAGTTTTTTAAAINTFGTTGSILDGATGTIVSYITPAGFKLKGFIANGEGQGYYYLQIGAGTTKYSYRTSIADKAAQIILPSPETIPSSTNLFLKVDNENGTTVNYEGAIIGE